MAGDAKGRGMRQGRSSGSQAAGARGRARASKRPAQGRRTRLQGVILALVACTWAALCLYPPWREVWTNFEGFRLHAPIAYGFPWAPPAAVFPVPRQIAWLRLTEECAVAAVIGAILYGITSRLRKR